MQELNLTPAQAIIMVILLIVLSAILSHFKSYTVIEKDDNQTLVRPVSTRYGAYIQSQGSYFN